MKRRLVQQGNSTLMVSLPHHWIKDHNLRKGDEITIEEYEADLILSTERRLAEKETTVELLNEIESSVRTIITNTYRRGFKRIVVKFKTQKQYELLLKIIQTRLIGFEVIKTEKNKCVVENVTEPSADQFDNMLQKVFLNIETMFAITRKRLLSDEFVEDYNEVAERIQKYDNFCRRVISIRKLENPHTELLWSFLTLIIHGYRELYYLNKILEKDEELVALVDEVEEVYKLVKKGYVKKDISGLGKVHQMQKEIMYKKGYALLRKGNPMTYHLLASCRQFYQANSPLQGILS